MRPRLRRHVRIGAIVAVAAVVAWLVLAHLFLNLVLPWILNRRPERLRVDYGFAWMLVPGRVSVRRLELRGQSRGLQWHSTLRRGTGRVGIPSLLDRQFFLDRFEGDGLRVRLRRRLAPGEEPNPGAPEIPGLKNPPVPAPEDLYPPRPDSRWRLVFEDAFLSQIEEIWIEEYRFEGTGRCGGTIEVRPRRSLRLGGVVLEIEAGGIRKDEQSVTEDLTGTLEWDLPETGVRENGILETLSRGLLAVSLESRSGTLGFLDSWLEELPNVSLSGGGGHLSAQVSMDDGELQKGSSLRAVGHDLRFAYMDSVVSGSGEVEWGVQGGHLPTGETVLTVRLDSLNLTSGPASQPQATGGSFHAVVRSDDLRPLDGVEGLELELQLRNAAVSDFAAYNVYMPENSPFRWEAGSAVLEADLKADRSNGSGRLSLKARDLVGSYEGLVLRGDLDLRAKISDLHLEERSFSVSGSALTVRNGAVSPVKKDSADADRDWWADVELTDGRIRTGRPLQLDVSATANLRDTEPIVEIFTQDRALVRVFEPLFTVRNVEATGRFRMDDRALRLTDLAASGERLEVRGCLRIVAEDQDGAFYGKRSVLQSALEIADGRRRLHPLKPVKWWTSQEICRAIERGERYPPE